MHQSFLSPPLSGAPAVVPIHFYKMIAFFAVLSFSFIFSFSWALHFPRKISLTTSTPVGLAQGVLDGPAVRYAVRYGSAQRWTASSVATTWAFPNGATNANALPLACPQPGMQSGFSEDCLSMILYVPTTISLSSSVPTLVWIHGGSFVVGSATGPGLDGSNLAAATGAIVAVIQYRLGALGFMALDGSPNLAVKDVVTSLSFLQKVIPSFGGSRYKITVAGQSSGANMVRALLAVPSASSLFQSAIIESDPMNFGFLNSSTQQLLLNHFTSTLGCNNNTCANTMTLDAILNAQTDLFTKAVTIDPSAGQAQPMRPVKDGSFITSPLDATSPFPHISKPVLISTVLTEAGPPIFTSFPNPLPQDAFASIVGVTLGTTRTNTILASGFYSAASSDARLLLQTLGTDYIYKCPSWTFARNLVQSGGRAYVGLYSVGATYPDNAQIEFCTQPSSVCHEGDIEIVFGTVPNPNPAQSALITQVQKRYKAFLRTGNPNTEGLPTWHQATTTDVHALDLGGNGEVPAGACDPSFWGAAVQYDYQVFGI